MTDTAKIKKNLIKDLEKLKAKGGYLNAGYPNYNTLFGRDSLIAAWQMLDFDPSIAKNTLKILAKYQADKYNNEKESEPGKILHEYRLSNRARKELPWSWPYYGSVDSTSLFIILLANYVQKSRDLEFLEIMWENAKRALIWHFENAKNNKYGFITYNAHNPHGLFHQGWKDSLKDHLEITPPVAIVEAQGYAYWAYKMFGKLAKIRDGNKEKLAKEAHKAGIKLKNNFSRQFWMKDEKYFALALDGKNKQKKSISSNPGHLLVCDDFLAKEEAEAVKNRLFKNDLLTIGGIRTLSASDPAFGPYKYHLGSIWPHDNWIIYLGFMHWGYKKEAKIIKAAMIRAYGALGHMPELYAVYDKKIMSISKAAKLEDINGFYDEQNRGVRANPLQAWSSGALLNMLGKK